MKKMNSFEYRTLNKEYRISNFVSTFREVGGLNFIYIITTLLLFHSCTSEHQTAEKTFAHFNLRYLQPEQQVKAEAHFSKGIELEKAVPTKMKNEVFFQGDKMVGKEIQKGGTKYNFAKKENFSTAYKFEFSPTGNKKLSHTLKMNSLDELAIQGDFIKSKDLQFLWKGNPLLQNESLVFLFNNEKNNFISFEINGPTTTSSINIPSEKLNKLPEGKGEIYLVRKQSNITDQSDVTIMSETEFYSRVISVTILP